MAGLRLYESQAINVTWLGIDLSDGWAEDTFLTITPESDRLMPSKSATGQYGYSKMADKGCTITLVLKQTSPTYNKIVKVTAAQQIVGAPLAVAPFMVSDPYGNVKFVADKAVCVAEPEVTFGAQMGDVTFKWVSETYISEDNPAELFARLTEFTNLL